MRDSARTRADARQQVCEREGGERRMKCADESREELKKAAAIDLGSVREWLDEWIISMPHR